MNDPLRTPESSYQYPDPAAWPLISEAYKAKTPAAAAGEHPSALDVQVAGGHYKNQAIQPVQYIHANKIGYFEGNVIKYVSRWKLKGGLDDLHKARHYIDLLIELEEKDAQAADNTSNTAKS